MGPDAYAARLVSTMTNRASWIRLRDSTCLRRHHHDAAIATGLSGCVFAYDAAKPEVQFVNDYPEPVVFIIEGANPSAYSGCVRVAASVSR